MKPSARLVKQAINDSNPPNFIYDSSSSSSAKKYKDDIDRIHQDLNILNQKIAEARGESSSVHSTTIIPPFGNDGKGGFVNGMRSMTESERNSHGKTDIKDVKISTLETLLEKIGEYDRLMLAKTVPVDTNNSGQPQRRKSFGTDLNLLPTHFRVIDRLVDLHNTSKRVTVLRQTVTPPTSAPNQHETPPTNPHYTPTTHMRSPPRQTNNNNQDTEALKKSNEMITELKANLQKFTQKLELSETKRIEKENQCEFLSKDIESLKKKYDLLQQSLQQKENELEEIKKFQHTSSSSSAQEHEKEIASYQQSLTQLQEKLEIEISYNQRILNVIRSKINFLQKDNSLLSENEENSTNQLNTNPQQYQNMPETFQKTLQLFDHTFQLKLSNYKSEIQLILSLKDMIENEMNSLTVQKDLLAKDFASLQEEHHALQAAYHSLSYETAMNHSKTSNKDTKQEDTTKPTEEIKALETENMTLKEQLRIKDQQIEEMLKNHSQSLLLKESSNRQFEIYSNELENKISIITRERDNLQFQYNNNHAELQQYKQLCEKLKCKIKELSAANAKDKGKDNNFFDTFEEVMQEEMFTMKMAFEAKLKAARDESEALSKKHQQEIQRLQASSSPFTAGKR